MKLGFIGAGNMAGAIAAGIVKNGYVKADDVFVSDVVNAQCERLREAVGVHIADSNVDLAKKADVIFLAVKPIFLPEVLKEIKPHIAGKAIVSIVTGWSHSRIMEGLGGAGDVKLACVMPNTPALVCAGMTAIIDNHTLGENMFAFVRGLFDSIGRTTLLPERLMEGFIAISGSSPAYVFMFIEAMADAGVKEGLPRALAYEAAAQAVKGAAEMVLLGNEHPAALKDAVCSPGGTTIEAVIELEKGGMRSAVMNAVAANANKARSLSK